MSALAKHANGVQGQKAQLWPHNSNYISNDALCRSCILWVAAKYLYNLSNCGYWSAPIQPAVCFLYIVIKILMVLNIHNVNVQEVMRSLSVKQLIIEFNKLKCVEWSVLVFNNIDWQPNIDFAYQCSLTCFCNSKLHNTMWEIINILSFSHPGLINDECNKLESLSINYKIQTYMHMKYYQTNYN